MFSLTQDISVCGVCRVLFMQSFTKMGKLKRKEEKTKQKTCLFPGLKHIKLSGGKTAFWAKAFEGLIIL